MKKFLPLFLLSACITKPVSLGVNQRDVYVEAAKNASTKAQIKQALGSPAATNLGGDKWIYFQADGEQFAFLDPSFEKYQIIAVEFKDKDQVASIQIRDIKDKSFATDSRETEADLGERGFFSELFGNVGSYNMGSMMGQTSSSD